MKARSHHYGEEKFYHERATRFMPPSVWNSLSSFFVDSGKTALSQALLRPSSPSNRGFGFQ